MANIDITRPHQVPLDEARAAIMKMATAMQERFGIESAWQGTTLQFKRDGIQGSIALSPDSIQVKAKLGMFFSTLKPMIEKDIQEKLEHYFGQVSQST